MKKDKASILLKNNKEAIKWRDSRQAFNGQKYNRHWQNQHNSNDISIILEDVEFGWLNEDIKKVVELWGDGSTFRKICEVIKREEDEVFLLLLHLSRQKIINKRKNYLWGEES